MLRNHLFESARSAYGPAAAPDDTPLGRARRRVLRRAAAGLDRVWHDLPPATRVWLALSRTEHARPGALVREVVCRQGPRWVDIFKAVTRYAAAATVIDRKREPAVAGFTYRRTGPLATSLRRRTLAAP